jgi:prophage tail gpP-like protein
MSDFRLDLDEVVVTGDDPSRLQDEGTPGNPRQQTSSSIPNSSGRAEGIGGQQDWPSRDEVAVLEVNNVRYENWTSVWVQHRMMEWWPLFRFTCAEYSPVPPAWPQLQFKPGDTCKIWLGGYLALAGRILVRQTAYDADNHQVLLIGVGHQWCGSRASIIHKDGNFDNKDFMTIANEVFAPFGSKFIPRGQPDMEPYEEAQAGRGEVTADFIERLARFRDVILGVDPNDPAGKNYVAFWPHIQKSDIGLIEGENILRCQCTIKINDMFNPYYAEGGSNGNDEKNGRKASEMGARADGVLPCYSPLLIPAEMPVANDGQLQKRVNQERDLRDYAIFEANVTVAGWLRNRATGLWKAGDYVYVWSPMAMIDQLMGIKTVTFSQDTNAGTTTTLELVQPGLLNNQIAADPGKTGVRKPGTSTGTTNDPAPPTPIEPVPAPNQPDPNQPLPGESIPGTPGIGGMGGAP